MHALLYGIFCRKPFSNRLLEIVPKIKRNIFVGINCQKGLINDILDMSKIEHGGLKLKEDIFSCDEFESSIIQ